MKIPRKPSIDCAFLESGKYCIHKANSSVHSKDRFRCPYTRNRKRCPLWKEGSTKLKDALYMLKTSKRKNGGEQ